MKASDAPLNSDTRAVKVVSQLLKVLSITVNCSKSTSTSDQQPNSLCHFVIYRPAQTCPSLFFGFGRTSEGRSASPKVVASPSFKPSAAKTRRLKASRNISGIIIFVFFQIRSATRNATSTERRHYLLFL